MGIVYFAMCQIVQRSAQHIQTQADIFLIPLPPITAGSDGIGDGGGW